MSDQNKPGLVQTHANYAAAYAKETIGSVTGSEDWKSSGQADKQEAIDGMKAASQGRDPQTNGYGKAEEMAGKAVGCEGMEDEGAHSKKQ
ncbi:hypothetical protein LTR37_000538 [Vermiconidia calcicola]|uniref:Uncharacterized protein n=1 Tax=Vermiconidia calcicola TaxID=1690605 RepID=A0ACC3NXX8_9PEZI|nr:hypothetical protein LTR37_000538 [Vermiconidia calcicola]